MTERLTPDICVIGAGAGGLTVAAAAAAFGVPVVLIERDRMGGECLNSGCVPSKALIAAGRRAALLAEAPQFGVAADVEVDFAAVHAHVHRVIAEIAANDSRERFSALGVRVIAGSARFLDERTLAVGDIEIAARRFVVATGSTPALPDIPGLAEVPYLTNETVFGLTVCPDHLLVVGAGAVGLELAQAFRRLGAAVTVLERAKPLGREDPECSAIVLDALCREGVTIRTGAEIHRVERTDGGVRMTLATPDGAETLDGTHLLVAAGRTPRIDGLGLEAARIASGPDGIMVDRRLRTTNKRVYAVGDVTGGPKSTHRASRQAELVIRNALFRLPVRFDDKIVPRVTYADPELAHVGLTEEEARARGYSLRIDRWPYGENDRARTEQMTRGHVKVVTTRRGRILGATIVGAQAGELITTWTLAISRGLNIRSFADVVVPYPTLAEIGRRAALAHFAPSLTGSMVRRIISVLRRLG